MKIKVIKAKVIGYSARYLTDKEFADGIRLTDYDDKHFTIVKDGQPRDIKAEMSETIIELDICNSDLCKLKVLCATFLNDSDVLFDFKILDEEPECH